MWFTFHASQFIVWHEAGGTELAGGLMILDETGSTGRADAVRAGVHAAVVAAGELRRASGVSQANRQGRRAVVLADADGPVIEHVASLVRGAGALLGQARVLAPRVDARGVGRTVGVATTAVGLRRAGQFAQLAHHESVLADAMGPVIAHLALLVAFAAGSQQAAGVAAPVALAGQTVGTVVVAGAAGAGQARSLYQRVALRVRQAGRLWHADVALRARAPGLVQDHATKRVDTAGATQRARVHAFQIDAGFLRRTLRVAGALVLCSHRVSVGFTVFFNAFLF